MTHKDKRKALINSFQAVDQALSKTRRTFTDLMAAREYLKALLTRDELIDLKVYGPDELEAG